MTQKIIFTHIVYCYTGFVVLIEPTFVVVLAILYLESPYSELYKVYLILDFSLCTTVEELIKSNL